MSNASDYETGGGGGAGEPMGIFWISCSDTWTPQFTGTARVYVIGAGGSGGACAAPSPSSRATGGGAGGMAMKTIDVVAGCTWTATIGSGGSFVSGPSTNGNTGGCSCFTDGTTSVIGLGGAGGCAGSASAALGGCASGGDVNIQGGCGGAVPSTTTGGGAVGLLGIGYSSTDVNGAGLVGQGTAIGPAPGTASLCNDQSAGFATITQCRRYCAVNSRGEQVDGIYRIHPLVQQVGTRGIQGSINSGPVNCPATRGGFGAGGGGMVGTDNTGRGHLGGTFAGGGGASINDGDKCGCHGGCGGGGGGAGGRNNSACSGCGGDGLIAIEVLTMTG